MTDRAREAFEAEIQDLPDPAVQRRCAHLLRRIASGGGVITPHDMQRLYEHLEPHQQAVAFVMDTRLPPDADVPFPTA